MSAVKRKGKAVDSVVLFWGVGFAALGWLVFKIAQLMGSWVSRVRRLLLDKLMRKRAVTIVAAGAAGWLILLLMCAYSKARERRN